MRATRLARAWSWVLPCFWLSFCLVPSRTLAVSPTGSLRETDTPHPPVLPPSVLHNLPLQFEENAGQAGKETRFLARGVGYTLLLERDGLRLALGHVRPISMRWAGANTGTISGREPTPTVTNYYLGSNPADWHLNVRSYRSVVCSEIYKGIDVLYHGSGQQLEYDFVVAPHADPAQIRMRFEGLQPILIGKDLALEGVGSLRIKGLNAYQWIHGSKKVVEASWRVHAGEASIQLGTYDHRRELIIDPIFFYGAYIGGASNDIGVSVVPANTTGFFYVALSTDSAMIEVPTNLTANPKCGTPNNGCPTDTLILGIDTTNSPGPPSPLPPYGSAVEQVPSIVIGSATYIGGTTGSTTPTAMVADQNLNLYVSGKTTDGANFPQLGAQPCSQSCVGFVAMFSTSLNATSQPASGSVTLQHSFGLPATPLAIAVDNAGNVYLTGFASKAQGVERLNVPSSDTDFQNLAASAIGQTPGPHAFLLELNPSGSTLFCSYIGGSGVDQGNAIALSGNSVYVVGQTTSPDFPATAEAYQRASGGGQDAFVLGASTLATSPDLVFSTYLGGSGTDTASSIAVAPSGSIVVAGSTDSSHFPIQSSPSFLFSSWPIVNTQGVSSLPTTPPTLIPLPTAVPAGAQDAFVTSLTSDGTQLLFTDFLGGVAENPSKTSAKALTVDNVGVIYVTGSSTATFQPPNSTSGDFVSGYATEDSNFYNNPSYQQGLSNIFFGEIDPTGKYLLEATLAGGSGTDDANSLTISKPLDPAGIVSIVGATNADNPTPPPEPLPNPNLFQSARQSQVDKVDPPAPAKASTKDNTGFFIQEALAGYCDMQLFEQVGTQLTFRGPCVSGTLGGTLFVTPTDPLLTAAITVAVSGNSLFGTVTVDLSSFGSKTLDFSFGFLPLGAIPGAGTCENFGSHLEGCGIVTSGGGAGTIFNVTYGALSVALSCSVQGTNCDANNTVPIGQPVTLNAVVTNGIPKTVFWSSSGGTFGSDTFTPSTSITFTPGGSGGPVVVKATPVVDPSLTPVPSITLSTVNLGGSGGPLLITSPPTQLVAGTTFQFRATNEQVTWTASAGTIDSSTGNFTAPNPPPAPAQITITATSTANAQISATTQVTIVPVPALVVPASITVPVGGTASTPISITAGTGIAGESMALACSPATLPSGVSCFFTPNPVVNTAGAMTTLQIVSNTVSFNFPNQDSPWKKYPFDETAIVVAGCIFIFGRRRYDRRIMMVLTTTLAATALLSLAACGTGGTFNPTTQPSHVGAGTYTINITVTGATPGAADYNEPLTTVPIKVTLQ